MNDLTYFNKKIDIVTCLIGGNISSAYWSVTPKLLLKAVKWPLTFIHGHFLKEGINEMATEEKKRPVKGILKSSSSFDHEKHKEYAYFLLLSLLFT